jgi:hypothetical protein
MSDILRIGFFEQFQDREDAILVSGDDSAITNLVDIVRSLSTGKTTRCQLDRVPFVRAHHGVSLLLESVATSSALRYVDRDLHWQGKLSNSTKPERAFIWQLSTDDWDDVAERISVLPGGRGHQYPADFLSSVSDVGLVIACNEYDDRWQGWQESGRSGAR